MSLAVTVDVSDAGTEAGAGEPARAPKPRTRVLLALAVVVLLLLPAVVVLTIRVIGAHNDRGRDDVVTAIARAVTVRMLTVNPGDPQSMMNALMDQASGDFKQQLIAQNDEFTAAVREAKVSSEGTVTESAIQTSSDEHASLLLTANATVKNAKAPAGQTRQYRIVLELHRLEGAPWTVSKLVFAP